LLELFELELELPLLELFDDELFELFELELFELFDDELFELFELELFELFDDELFELFELELLDDNAGTGAGAGGGGGGGATVEGTVGATVVGGSVVGGWVVGATVVVGGGVVVVVMVDVELSMIGSGVPPSSPSARIVPVVTAAARPTAPIALARHAHRGGRVGRIVVLSLSSRAPSAGVR